MTPPKIEPYSLPCGCALTVSDQGPFKDVVDEVRCAEHLILPVLRHGDA